MWIFLWGPAFNYLGCLTRDQIAGLFGSSPFNFLKETLGCFPQQLHCFKIPVVVHRVPISLWSCQHLLFYVIIMLMVTILMGIRCKIQNFLFSLSQRSFLWSNFCEFWLSIVLGLTANFLLGLEQKFYRVLGKTDMIPI